MHVADEVDQEHQGFAALDGRRGRVTHEPAELRNFHHDAAFLAAVAGQIEMRGLQRDIDVVPGGGLGAGAAHFIGPTGRRGHGFVRTKNLDDAGSNLRSELGLGDPGDEGVAFRPPGKCRAHGHSQGNQSRDAHGKGQDNMLPKN